VESAALHAYEKLGVAGIFIVLYVGTMVLFIRQLTREKREAVDRERKMMKVVVGNTEALREVSRSISRCPIQHQDKERKNVSDNRDG
jgi:hypothetical protein